MCVSARNFPPPPVDYNKYNSKIESNDSSLFIEPLKSKNILNTPVPQKSASIYDCLTSNLLPDPLSVLPVVFLFFFLFLWRIPNTIRFYCACTIYRGCTRNKFHTLRGGTPDEFCFFVLTSQPIGFSWFIWKISIKK